MPAAETGPPPSDLSTDLSGLDALELAEGPKVGRMKQFWDRVWPRLAAIGLALAIWQIAVWTKWRPDYLLPPPATVFKRLFVDFVGTKGTDSPVVDAGLLGEAISVTMTRAAAGFLLALVIGSLIGMAVASSKHVRSAIGSFISGLQTMPSIAWFPLAVLLFQLGESPIMFVVVLGAAPAIANGLLSGVDHIPPVLLRAGRVMGARGLTAFRHVIFPAALPSYVAGLKQGWAFSWRSLMAAELLSAQINRPSIGVKMSHAQSLADADGLLATMIVILVLGIAVNALVFDRLGSVIRSRRGLAA
ncbi:MAG: ABC transporter permease [Actinomycetota bacterium]